MGAGASSLAATATGVAVAAIACPPAAGLAAAGMIFGTGVTVGVVAALGAGGIGKAAADAVDSAVSDALDAVDRAAEAVMGYLRAAKDAACSAYEAAKGAACSAYEAAKGAAAWTLRKLKEAAALVVDRVVGLLRRVRGCKSAAAARHEMRRAGKRNFADVFPDAVERVARCRRRIMGEADEAPPSSSAILVPAATEGALVALPGSSLLSGASDVARRAARRAAEMMELVLEAVVAEASRGGDSIHAAARSSIAVIVKAVALCLDVVVLSPTADANAHA